MALKNYTTEVPASKTVSEIHLMLANHGARKIMFDYSTDGKTAAIIFSVLTPAGERGIKLPANTARVQEVLMRQKSNPKIKGTIDASPEQAERVAWRIVKDWLASQLAILETEMVDMEQLFMPYIVTRSGQTLYDAYLGGALMLPE